MRKRLSMPSPAMIVAVIALVMASTGGAIAAVNFARNAGAVDGKSAVSSTASLRRAADKVVATKRSGTGRGQIPAKFLELNGAGVIKGQGAAQSFSKAIQVVDNNTTAPQVLLTLPSFGTLAVSCRDSNAAAGKTDPQTILNFVNQSGRAINLSREVDGNAPFIRSLPNATTDSQGLSLGNPHQFQYTMESFGTSVVIIGAEGQFGQVGTAGTQCVQWGQALRTSG
ncbi:MAG: hypothetical protein M3Z33_11350 [Actinomycetota bacterium]|nr:hypothetical protein [Actinomycetota bacterium]